MRNTNVTYRLTKVANKTVSVAVCALLGVGFGGIAGVALANTVITAKDTGSIYVRTFDKNQSVLSTSGSDTGTWSASLGAETKPGYNFAAYLNGNFVSGGVDTSTLTSTSTSTSVGCNGNWNGCSASSSSTSTSTSTSTLAHSTYASQWTATLGLNGTTLNATASPYAVQTDNGVTSTLNMAGNNRLNGITQVNQASITTGETIFNGSLYTPLDIASGATATFTSSATQIAGAITAAAGSKINLYGNNTVTDNITGAGSTVNVSGPEVVFNGNVTVASLNFTGANGTGASAIFASGSDLLGDVNYTGNHATLTLSDGSNVTGNIVENGTRNGVLVFQGNSSVSGAVGAVDSVQMQGNRSLVTLNANNTIGGTNNTTQLGGADILADYATLQVKGLLTGNVNLKGHTSRVQLQDTQGSAGAAQGMRGTLDFGKFGVPGSINYGAGTLEIAENTNLTFGSTGVSDLKLANADQATLVFKGASNVTGSVGSVNAAVDHATPLAIYAGNANTTVTFNQDVNVGDGKLNVGGGSVNLNGKLTGALAFGPAPTNAAGLGATNYPGTGAYSNYGGGGGVTSSAWGNDGQVNVADARTISSAVTTTTVGRGTVNFLGAANTQADMGTEALPLKAISFNTVGDDKQVVIGHNVYADTVTVGSGTDSTAKASTVTFSNSGLNLGGDFVLANQRTILNIGSTRNTVLGEFETNNATLNFTLAPDDKAFFTVADGPGSGKITTSILTLTGQEKVNVKAVGSLRNGATYSLVGADEVNGSLSGNAVSSNSYVLDLTLSTPNAMAAPEISLLSQESSPMAEADSEPTLAEDTLAASDDSSLLAAAPVVQNAPPPASGLVLTVNRANDNYVTKSLTQGHFSNNAAIALGEIAANGSQVGDMVDVLMKLDINDYGFGNNASNLANQVKKLPPIANGSLGTAAFSASMAAAETVNDRLLRVRNESNTSELSKRRVWGKVYGGTARQQSIGYYDGYQTKLGGASFGGDTQIGESSVMGAALSFSNTAIDQKDFRLGDSATVNSYQLNIYGMHELGRAYIEGNLLGALHDTRSYRNTALARTATAKYQAKQIGLHIGGGYRFVLNDERTMVTPLLALEGDWLKQPRYIEEGAGALNLTADSNQRKRLRGILGARLSTELRTGRATYIPHLVLKYAHDFASRTYDINTSYVGGGRAFTTTGLAQDKRDSLLVSTGVQVLNEKRVSIQVQYDGEFKSGYRSHGGQVKALWAF